MSCPAEVECCFKGPYAYGQNKSKRMCEGYLAIDTICKELAQDPAHCRYLIMPVPFPSYPR